MPNPQTHEIRLALPLQELRRFCERRGLKRLEVFGSVLRDDFGPASDVDFLFELKPGVRIGLLELGRMESELTTIVGRKVDLVSRRSIERSPNRIRREAILSSARLLVDAA